MKAALQPNSKPRWLKPIRWLWFVLALGYGALWLLSVPRFYEQASTLTIEPYKLGERVIYDNARAEKQALERGVSPPVSAIIEIAIVTLQVVVYYLLTALIAWRTTNGFGWFTAFVLLFLSVGSVMEMPVGVARPFPYANVFAEIPGYLVWPAWMLWLHLFPNGHFVPRWSARPVIIVLCLLVVLQISSLLTVLGVLTALPENIDTFAASTLGPILTLPVFGLIFYSQVHRYRYVSTLMERQQTKWFLLGLGMFFIGIFCYTIFPVAVQNSVIAQNVLALTFLIFPISVTLAILRYRLFDVDILIRRTLQYSLISGLLGLTYFGLVIVLQNLTSAVGGQKSSPSSLL